MHRNQVRTFQCTFLLVAVEHLVHEKIHKSDFTIKLCHGLSVLGQQYPIEISVMMEMFYMCAVQFGSH